MSIDPEIPADWTETERWVWERITAGELANLNARESDQTNPNPNIEEGWTEGRRISTRFIQTILTQKEFVDRTPFGGVLIRGALFVYAGAKARLCAAVRNIPLFHPRP